MAIGQFAAHADEAQHIAVDIELATNVGLTKCGLVEGTERGQAGARFNLEVEHRRAGSKVVSTAVPGDGERCRHARR